jgi:hypothetical protein
MGMLILFIVLGLLVWICWTWRRYVDPGLLWTSGDEEEWARARRRAAHLDDAEFWAERASAASSPAVRLVAANLAAHHRDRARELELPVTSS